MKKTITISIISIAVLISIFAAAKKSETVKTKVTIAIAANFILPMNDIKINFEKDNPTAYIEIISGASGTLTAQIENGAPFEIFASADMAFPLRLKDKGFTVKGPAVYAQGSLVLFSAGSLDLSRGMAVLKERSVKKIVIANPETAPYGKAAVSALKKYGIYNEVKSKLVYGENINKVVPMVLNAADVGFAARSVLSDPLLSEKYSENRNWVFVDQKLYDPLEQGAVLLKKSKINAKAVLLYEYLFSDNAKKIYLKYGYAVN